MGRERTVLGVFPELFEVGGIQLVSRHAGATLVALAERTGRACELLGLNDAAGDGTFRVGAREFGFRGFGRNKAALVAHLLRRAPKTELIVAGHVNLGPAARAVQMLRPQVRYWIVAHGIEVWEPLAGWRQIALQRASGIVAVSRHTADAVARVQGVESERINVLSPALDPSYFSSVSATTPWPAPPDSLSLLTVARLLASEPGKGVDTVIRALPRLLLSFPNLHFVIIGDGDAKPELEKLAATCGVASRVIFLGSRTGSLRGYYEAADVFVMPSRQEGFGIVYLEAMAAGKPVLAGNCGGAPEVVVDGETGFLVPYGDIDTLEARLASLLANDGLRKQMGDAGQRRALEQHRFEQFRDRLMVILGATIE